MSMNKNQIGSIVFFFGLFALLYFGCDTKNKNQRDLEKSRSNNLELVNVERLIAESRKKLTVNGQTELAALEDSLLANEIEESKLNYYKSLASLWYSERFPLISGYYAEKVAKIENNEQAWSITGTTFALAAKFLEDEQEKKYAIQKSRTALESAISMNTENIDNQINLALSFVDNPIEENPMKGILMLVDLNKKNPDSVPVLYQLGRLALGTNQLDKAVERLSRVVELDPENKNAHCLLYEVYSQKGETEKANKGKNIM